MSKNHRLGKAKLSDDYVFGLFIFVNELAAHHKNLIVGLATELSIVGLNICSIVMGDRPGRDDKVDYSPDEGVFS